MRNHSYRDRSARSPSPRARSEPLSEDRFQALIQAASSLFSAAEQDKTAERAAVIEDILHLMEQHGLTVDDLVDGDAHHVQEPQG